SEVFVDEGLRDLRAVGDLLDRRRLESTLREDVPSDADELLTAFGPGHPGPGRLLRAPERDDLGTAHEVTAAFVAPRARRFAMRCSRVGTFTSRTSRTKRSALIRYQPGPSCHARRPSRADHGNAWCLLCPDSPKLNTDVGHTWRLSSRGRPAA